MTLEDIAAYILENNLAKVSTKQVSLKKKRSITIQITECKDDKLPIGWLITCRTSNINHKQGLWQYCQLIMPDRSSTPKCCRISLVKSSHSQNLTLKIQTISYNIIDNYNSSLKLDGNKNYNTTGQVFHNQCTYHMLVRRFTRSYPPPKEPRNLFLSMRGQWVIIMTWSNHHIKPIQMRPRMLYL